MHYERWRKTGDAGDANEARAHLRPVVVDGRELYCCATCGEMKSPEAFALAAGCRSGRRGTCKPCIAKREKEQWSESKHRPSRSAAYKRDRRLRRLFGLSAEDYDKLLAEQGGVCAVCAEPSTWNRREGDTLVVDHDHQTGKVRGLLCHACNQAIGLLRDRPDLMRAAASYVECLSD